MRFRLVAAAAVLAIVSVCAVSSPASSPERIVRAQAEPEATIDVRVRLVREPSAEWRRDVVVRQNPASKSVPGMLIEVSIATQRLTAWQDGVVVLRTPISTGMPGYDTPPGHFHVLFKSPNAWSAKWGVIMPWALNIHGNYFIHQVTHYPGSTVNIGESRLGTRASHGCVRVGTGVAERLYRWANVGTPVWIH